MNTLPQLEAFEDKPGFVTIHSPESKFETFAHNGTETTARSNLFALVYAATGMSQAETARQIIRVVNESARLTAQNAALVKAIEYAINNLESHAGGRSDEACAYVALQAALAKGTP